MSKTAKATEARKKKALIRRRFKEFLPDDVDPIKVYREWKNAMVAPAKDGSEPDDSFLYFMLSQANAAGIDPRVPRQIQAVPFWNKDASRYDWTVIIQIEGLVTIAENTGMYGGTTKPEYEFGDDGQPISCTVGVHKIVQGVPATSFQTVYFDEYDTGKNLWRSKPKTMLKKVAHAHALRATFSACAGMYVAEEMERADVIDGEVVPDIKEDVKKAKSKDELSNILQSLPVAERKTAVPLINEKIRELSDDS